MGIPGFFAWLRKNCPFIIKKVPRHSSITADPQGLKAPVDNLCLDMNGIIHEAAQKVFKYGNYKELKSKYHPAKELPFAVMKKKVFFEIGRIMDKLVDQIKPRKRILVMVDGPASKSKRAQQRSRRYRSVTDPDKKFDTNAISPGTEFMDHMSKYLDYHIRLRCTTDPGWMKLQVVFSNEKVPGEGEHKLINFIRKYCTNQESFVFYGLDADLIMLTLSIQNRLYAFPAVAPFWIVREDQYDLGSMIIIDIALLREWLVQELTWGMDATREGVIDDFIFLCFLLGNDFLPHSPSVDLLDGGVELLFASYVMACEKENAHLVTQGKDDRGRPTSQINKLVFKELLFQLTLTEKMILEDSVKKDVFADPLLQKHLKTKEIIISDTGDTIQIVVEDEDAGQAEPVEPEEKGVEKKVPQKVNKTELDYEAYREEYYRTKIPNATALQVCHEFFWGMEWVFQYYTHGVPSWDWCYPFAYSPFAKEMCDAIDSYQSKPFVTGRPIKPFLQLLTILPPQSKDLIPKPLSEILNGMPTEVKLDLAGKKFEWQAVAILPDLPDKKIEQEYLRFVNSVDDMSKKRNLIGKEYIYVYDPSKDYEVRSYYGTFRCAVKVVMLEDH